MSRITRKIDTQALVVLAGALLLSLPASGANAACPGTPGTIEAENCLPGNPASQWDVTGAGDPNLQGFATDISVNRGETVSFKVSTTATAYRIDIYRLGYYGGDGARLVATVPNASTTKTSQPACLTDATGLVDCGNWSVSASWAVPASAVSGIYLARLQGEAGVTGASHVVFVVRNDGGTSSVLFQTADTTWQAYNRYGGNNLYGGTGPGTGLSGVGRAYKVSYNRPFTTRETAPEDWLFNAEYPMVRWLERNGYEVSYTTGVDTDRRGSELLNHKIFLSVGHDEYWSAAQRTNVEAARDNTPPVHLAFFSGNEVFWKTRWESSIAGTPTTYRTLVCYKETHEGAKIDPSPQWTGTWRDPRFSPPADGGRPENALTGTIFTVNGTRNDSFQVPEADGKMRFWRDTPNVASLAPGQVWSAPAGTLGYEWDEDLDNGFRPAGVVRLSSTTIDVSTGVVQDYGSTYAPGVATHHLVFHKRPNGALVFGSGTVQWPWGLDANHDRGGAAPSVDMQQATVNLFADMGVQPVTLQGGLLPASASADVGAPVSDITFPASGATLPALTPMTVLGTATDGPPGRVGGVEVSVDGGLTWHPAVGRASWSYVWTPLTTGSRTLLSRAVDDSGNRETPGAGRTVTIGPPTPPTGPVSIWAGGGSPAATDVNDGQPIETGVKFRSALAGWITHLRFYKGTLNTGTHTGHLWTSAGTLLATATFSGETASGWQQMALGSPVAIAADTTYVASYHSSSGYYATTDGYFAQAYINYPLTALADGTDGPNGVYKVGAPGFPSLGFAKTNYWVDVVFTVQPPGPDTIPPTVVSATPASGASGVLVGSNVTAAFSEPLAPATVNGATVELRDAAAQLVAATVTWVPATNSVTLDPNAALAYSTTYTATFKGGGSGLKDVANNPLAVDFTRTFTTQAPPPPPPTEGPGGPILVVGYAANPFSRYYAEILRAEGLNAFAALDISAVDATVLSGYDVVILGEMPLTTGQVTMFTTWVNGGGNLIAMRPDKKLAGLLGLTDAASTLPEGYLLVNTASSPGQGIVGQTMQFHGTADRYTLAAVSPAAVSIATLFSDATTATPNPAATLRTVGSGEAAAFAFDLARSIVYTRQGNPAWAGDERDGIAPVRSDDMFYGAKAGDVQPDWVNLARVAIPQADEQQRLLANLVLKMNLDRKPLPRFWYFPRMEKAVVVMASDNHGSQNVEVRFLADQAASPTGCSVDNWDCVRSTVYLYSGALASDALAKQYEDAGFEVGLHVNTNCSDWTPASLAGFFTTQVADFYATYPSLLPLATHRTHCIAWSDWASQPKVELQNGIRLDTNYYYWPPAWVNDTPGFFTGSGMPMRFADLDGTMIDVYQATTQMTDESGQTYPFTINTLLDRATGAEGYFGAFVANIHTDGSTEDQAASIVSSALSRSVPVVSAKQMLAWLDGRNGSSFTGLSWSSGVLSFGISVGAGANGLQAMVPTQGSAGVLTALTRDGVPVPYTTQTIKGTSYAVFAAQPGNHQASYGLTFVLTVTPPLHGTITGTGIACGTGGVDCTETYGNGTVVALAATPDTGYDFGGWAGACTGTGACSVTMTAPRIVGATFAIQRYALTVTAPTNGTITASGINCGAGGADCTEAYDYGTVVALTATPATGYDLSGWTGACSGTGPCSVTMTAARAVGATFAIQLHTLTVTPPTNGTITGTGIACGTGGVDCTQTFDYGTVVPLTATPDTGYDLGGWTGACSGTGACSATMTAARTVGAGFTIERHTLTVTAPTGGTVTGTGIACGTGGVDCSETYDYGTVVALTATPSTGYDFGGWSGDCAGPGACSVTMTGARTVGATFAIQRYTLTVTAPTNGTITGSGIACGTGGADCTQDFDYGAVVPLAATPDTGYDFGGWSGACTGTGACSVTMTGARAVGGTFTIERHTLTVTPPTHGAVTGTGIACGTGGVDCAETYDYGTVVLLTATPDTGYDFGGWSGDCTGTGSCSATMTAARTVGATFAIQRHTLTVTAPAGGTITGAGIACGTGGVDCTQDYDYGTVVPLTATPDPGHDFGVWTGDCTGTGGCSATMTAARTVGATFVVQRYTLTVTRPTRGTITATGISCGTGGADCTQDYDYGTVVAVTAVPDAGYKLRVWTGACTGTGACSLGMTVSRSVGGLFNAAFQGTRTGPGGYEGPGFTTNESAPAPGEAAPVAGPVVPQERTEPVAAPESVAAPEPVGAPESPLVDAPRVLVSGEVRRPGAYAWFPGMTARDLVEVAGGVTPEGSETIDLDHPVKAGETLVVPASVEKGLARP